ncbi:MAG: urease accessory protein [Bacteroidota bacterium]
MQEGLSLAFAALIGFGHAFEADHLLAVSALVAKAENQKQVWKNGFIWGLGHTSTLLLMGILVILLQVHTLKTYFDFFELFVGVMLIILGILRLFTHVPSKYFSEESSHDKEAYGIGLIHGLAGSGTLIILILANQESNWGALSYLILFGLGSALGMALAASLMCIPLLGRSNKRKPNPQWRRGFTWLSSLLCMAYGFYILMSFTI